MSSAQSLQLDHKEIAYKGGLLGFFTKRVLLTPDSITQGKTTIRWAEVTALRHGRVNHTVGGRTRFMEYQLDLRDAKGQEIKIHFRSDALLFKQERAEAAYTHLMNAAMPVQARLINEHVQAWRNGSSIAFDHVKFHRDHLEGMGNRVKKTWAKIPYNELEVYTKGAAANFQHKGEVVAFTYFRDDWNAVLVMDILERIRTGH